jgi:hypothetical protein
MIEKSVENRVFSIFGVPAYVKTHYAYQTSAFKPAINLCEISRILLEIA